MKTNAYFSKIHKQIISEIEGATFEIIIAVAWFTDRDIFQALCKRAVKGLSIHLAIMDDSINKRAAFEYSQLLDSGGLMYLIPAKNKLMHHKFCVIDRDKVITGSFNWSKSARRNDENIVVIEEAGAFAIQYIDTFNQLLAKNHYTVIDLPKLDTESIARRLELINNLILLGDYNDIDKHVDKLKNIEQDTRLIEIINTIGELQYDRARRLISDYLTKLRALIEYTDPLIIRLKQELLTLEYQLNALSDEKAELYRQISDFNYQYNLHLGDIILEFLRLKKLKAQKQYEQAKKHNEELLIEQAEDEYNEAKDDYEQFNEGNNTFKEEEEVITLNEDELKELKQLYRKASMLCHPDRVSEEDKPKAHEIFIELQRVYSLNDIAGVRKIYNNLREGNFFTDISTDISELEQLEKVISELKVKVDKVTSEIKSAIKTEAYQILKDIKHWDNYFKDLIVQYNQEIKNLKRDNNE